MGFEKYIDLFMFREGTEEEADGTTQPIITTGSIVWGVLLRSSILIFLTFFLVESVGLRKYWWLLFFVIWFGAAYPGWRQFQLFQKRIKKVEEETLCGSCKHFDSGSQLCRIYDEHVTKDYLPCEGLNWEPTNFENL